MTNAQIAQAFQRIALILDLRGDENPFRVRAYERAAMSIENLSAHVEDIYKTGGLKALTKIPGIGKDLALKIEELLKTGHVSFLSQLEHEMPKGLLELMDIEGLGPKKTKFLWQKYRIENIDGLVAILQSKKLLDEKGWGEKTVQNLLASVARHGKSSGRVLLPVALDIAEEIVSRLEASRLCKQIEIAGSLRRRRETVGDIDILATSDNPEKVLKFFTALPNVESVIGKGPTKASVRLTAGIQADLRVVEPDVFGAALHYFTGSKDHNVAVRKIGVSKRITISEYGVFHGSAKKKGKLIAAKTEADVFRSVGLPYIPPELREDRGEILAAANGTLPDLISEKDLKGDLHMHTNVSDGSATAEQMARSALDKGLEYICITDHASAMGMVKGVKSATYKQYINLIRAAQEKVPDIKILTGVEVDIAADGSLYLTDDILRAFDIVVASVHQKFKQERFDATKRLVTAIKNPFVTMIGHPLGRKLRERDGLDVDMEEVLSAAKEHGVWMELNASPDRLDLPDVFCRRAKELGVLIAIDSDAHSQNGFNRRFGVDTARRGWLEKDDVVNTRSWNEFEKILKVSSAEKRT